MRLNKSDSSSTEGGASAASAEIDCKYADKFMVALVALSNYGV
jgi:hypothetical protein